MKKLAIGSVIMMLVLSLGMASAFAATPTKKGNNIDRRQLQSKNHTQMEFVDKDGDGICDNRGTGVNSGKGNGRGQGNGWCRQN